MDTFSLSTHQQTLYMYLKVVFICHVGVDNGMVGISLGTVDYWVRLKVPMEQALRLYKVNIHIQSFAAQPFVLLERTPTVLVIFQNTFSRFNIENLLSGISPNSFFLFCMMKIKHFVNELESSKVKVTMQSCEGIFNIFLIISISSNSCFMLILRSGVKPWVIWTVTCVPHSRL